jgi:hypothetical protein
MNNGSELRTINGRAEVLLTPGTFLRVGPSSAIRMVSNQLDDTRIELLNGSAVLDQGSDALASTSVTVLYNLDQVHIKKPGRYRFDSEPPEVKVESGDAEVIADGKSIEAGAGYAVSFEGKLTARKLLDDSLSNESGDDLDRWNAARDSSVAENNLNAAATSDLSGVIDGWQNNPDALLQSLGIPPYIPGMSSVVPSVGYGSSLYGSGLYGSGLYGPGTYGSLYGSGLYGPGAYGLYGLGAVSPLFVYPLPLYRSYRSPYSTYGYSYRRPTVLPSRGGYGPAHSLGPVRPGMGVGRPAIGVGRVGGHR